jgi:hypothetical protein
MQWGLESPGGFASSSCRLSNWGSFGVLEGLLALLMRASGSIRRGAGSRRSKMWVLLVLGVDGLKKTHLFVRGRSPRSRPHTCRFRLIAAET